MSDRAVLTDRGYQPYRGPRLGTSRAVRAIIRDGIRRTLGLRRKARRKVLPWLMIGMMWLTMFVILLIVWFQGTIDVNFLDNPYTAFLGAVALYGLILTSYAAPELLVPDRKSGALNIYFSRPLRVGHYLLAKGGALAAVILGFWIIPLYVYHLGLAFLSENGFASYLGSHINELWRIPATAVCYLLMYGSVALLCTALLKRVGIAAGACVIVFFAFNIAATIAVSFSDTTARWLSLLAFEQHVTNLRNWIFGQEGTDLLQRVGFDPWVSALVMFIVVVISGFLIKLTYRKQV